MFIIIVTYDIFDILSKKWKIKMTVFVDSDWHFRDCITKDKWSLFQKDFSIHLPTEISLWLCQPLFYFRWSLICFLSASTSCSNTVCDTDNGGCKIENGTEACFCNAGYALSGNNWTCIFIGKSQSLVSLSVEDLCLWHWLCPVVGSCGCRN